MARQRVDKASKAAEGDADASADRLRIDRCLWHLRLYKTRSLAAEEVSRDRVTVNGVVAKPSREIKPGDRIRLRQQGPERELVVLALSKQRGPAPVAQLMYEETPESRAASRFPPVM